MILDGKKLSKEIKEEVKEYLQEIAKDRAISPGLAVIVVGSDPASKVYANSVLKGSGDMGIRAEIIEFNEEIKQEDLIKRIEDLNVNSKIDGIIIKLPLPKHINEDRVLNRVCVNKDVDGFKAENLGRLFLDDEHALYPCTPAGIIEILKRNDIAMTGKDVVIIGRSNIVGKPMAGLLINESTTVTVCHSQTKNLVDKTKNADIIIVAVGKPKFLKKDMIKEGAVVVDVGINRVDGKIVGDVDFEEVSKKASYITPVPGGVGPMTVAMLFKNVVKSFNKSKIKNKK